MNRTKRILITSAGGLVGTFLIKHFREMDNYYLVGTDMSGYVPLKEKLNATGFCINTNYLDTQEIKHYHLHIVPNTQEQLKDTEEIYNILKQ